MSNKRTWQVPFDNDRLLELCRTWDFHSDVEDLADCDDGEPRFACAYRRIWEYMEAWRDHHGAGDDPWFDEELGLLARRP
jgi:hypothetical protein